jgi:hypothetical protein
MSAFEHGHLLSERENFQSRIAATAEEDSGASALRNRIYSAAAEAAKPHVSDELLHDRPRTTRIIRQWALIHFFEREGTLFASPSNGSSNTVSSF